jgi:hypothetical protein
MILSIDSNLFIFIRLFPLLKAPQLHFLDTCAVTGRMIYANYFALKRAIVLFFQNLKDA